MLRVNSTMLSREEVEEVRVLELELEEEWGELCGE